ncbi:hypothetical protein [Novosphingobium taihuense]|uniref:Uncharacterized protein n=1 Tax=Novosphingobium taihuense TaxID=260085 RepID=A0A7W7AB15_9SPHN|nr:hypothetical protein [Novosphingobium taihuense]MBB4613079.1 hypothetical protein [Novosphingobium taihuense]TWH85222.1 hypothetical protein IQ25_01977 [Novosphingobium taihuense]
MATANLPTDETPHELSGVVIGWKHRAFARNIHLTVQSTSKARPTPDAVDTHHLLMTRNQAMLLANYLMRATGQELPDRRPSLWQRLFG